MIQDKNKAYISRKAIAQNYQYIQNCLQTNQGNVPQIIATVKANAYGHGVDIVTEVLGEHGCSFFAVSSEREAIEVRKLEEKRGRHPRVLILGYTFPENAPSMAENDIECTAVSPTHAIELAGAVGQGRLKIHIALDTGMHRIGFACDTPELAEQTADDIAALAAEPHLRITGIFSHFACCDDEMLDGLRPVSNERLTDLQLARYGHVLALLEARGVSVGLRHIANSAAILSYVPAWLDAVRAGIILYGLSPDGKPWRDAGFRPVMTLVTTVAHIQTLRPGEHVSYGATYTAETERTIATLPIGYADGWIRAYTGAAVMLHGEDYPIVGRICMDQCMIDITDAKTPVAVGDPVVLFGDDNGARLADLAKRAGTIVYECTCQVSHRVPRIPID